MSSIGSICKNFASSTSLHSVPRIADTPSYKVRVFWSVVFIVSLGIVAWQLHYLVRKYMAYEVTLEQQLSFEAMVFPAVTLCSLNPFVKEKALEVPQIRNLAAAYNQAVGRLHVAKMESERRKREVGASELVEDQCYHDAAHNFYMPISLNTAGKLEKESNKPITCFCVNDQWDFVSYCAPLEYWKVMSCLKKNCLLDKYCGAFTSTDTFGEPGTTHETVDCVCNTLQDGCYFFENIPDAISAKFSSETTTMHYGETTDQQVVSNTTYLTTTPTMPITTVVMATGETTTSKEPTTTVVMVTGATTKPPESSTNGELVTSMTTPTTINEPIPMESGSTESLTNKDLMAVTTKAETTPTTIEEPVSIATSTKTKINETLYWLDEDGSEDILKTANPADYSFAFEGVTDEMALQAKAKETLVFITGELEEKTKVKISNPFADFIRMCSFNGKSCDMRRDFQHRFDPFYGNCFTFNGNQNDAKRTDRAGAIYGLKLMLYADVSKTYLFSSDSPGIRLALHRQNEEPFPEVFGYSAPNSFVSSYAVKLKSVARLQAPYGHCVNSSQPDSKPHHFLYRSDFTLEGCYRSCYQREVVKYCNCADPRFPLPPTYGYCSSTNTKQHDCLKEASVIFDKISKDNTIDCNCSQPCEEFVHTPMFSGSLYPTPKLKLAACSPPNNKTCLDHFKRNSAVVEVYFQQLNLNSLIEVPSYPLANLLSDVGGTLGLWLGASVITSVEFFALLGQIILHLWHRLYQRLTDQPDDSDSVLKTV